jgi:allophanate hydrolase
VRLEDTIDEVYRRIEAHASNPVFIHLAPKAQLLERARGIAALPRGPMWGRIVAVKDNIDVAGMPTTAACPAFSHVPSSSAHAVQKLLDAGALVIGKTNLDQFATGLVGTRSPYGACRNAIDGSYISGGSSSGSAVAVALGIAGIALGTDTAGSGRVPAAFNGLVGLKPTRGLVSTRGVVPACRSLDCVSVFARTCAEALEALQAVEGPDPQDPWSRQGDPVHFAVERFRFAVPDALEFHGDAGYEALFARALARLEALGGTRVTVDFAPFLEAQQLLYGPWVAERTAALEQHLGDMLPVTRGIVQSGLRHSAADVFRAQHRLAELRLRCEELLKGCDLMVVPGAPTIYRLSEVEGNPVELNSRLGHYTNFVNLLDMAALTVPAGARADGLPFGITLIGRAFSDRSLARLGARFTGEAPIAAATHSVRIAVVGAHLSGMPLNVQLTERGAALVGCTRTAAAYRLYSLGEKPGMVRAPGGAKIEVEVWEMPLRHFGSFVALIPAPLGIGTVELEDGSAVKGFLCEASALEGRPEITSHGGWRSYMSAKR